ncbi:hypothetical protein BDV95DRAFT_606486 [Massariosphaeria phaeospora]|uniref:DUF6604 domain-containing protein n=1 Tax=Massariosphaeria phaeospora TaxID=100035 RepID=A0A7C8M8H4_9PLEO|nr:hypothetical protein BDV95DRAFT_606486 [Massariosphaeria phaeospora]
MGLSPLLVDTYRRYKSGTKTFVQWLATTARATRAVDDVFDGDSIREDRGKQNGKKRNNPNRYPKTHAVPMGLISRLTDAITTDKSARVPPFILVVLKDVIPARKSCAAWYQAHQTDETTTNKTHNDGYQYFISILEESYDALLPLKEKKDAKRTGGKGQDVNGLPSANIFEHLDVEDCSDTDFGLDNASQPTKNTADSYRLERQQRMYPTVMDTAIDVMRRLNETFIDDFPRFEQHHEVIAYLYQSYCDPNSKATIQNQTEHFATYESDGLRLSSKTFFCDRILHILRQFYSIATGTSCNEEKKAEFSTNRDGLVQAVCVMRNKKKFYMWAVFAVQLFLDTHRELKSEVKRGLADFRKETDWLLVALQDCHDFGQTNDIDAWHRLNNPVVADIIESLKELVKTDIIQGMKKYYFKDSFDRYDWGDYFLFENHPMFCGLLLQKWLVRCHQLGIDLAGHQNALKATIFLKHAAQLTHQASAYPRWADMDYIIDMHGEPWIFVGGKPELIQQCHSRFELAMGTSAAVLTRNHPGPAHRWVARGHLPTNTNRSRIRKSFSIVRYAQASQWNSGQDTKDARATNNPGVMLEALVKKYLDADDLGCFANPLAGKKKGRQILTPLQCLAVFKQAMKADEFALRFDLLTLNRRCVEFLRRVQRVCVLRSPLEYSPQDCDVDVALIPVAHMLSGVAGAPRQQPTRFRETCQLLRKVIAEEGNAEYLKAAARVGVVTPRWPPVPPSSPSATDPDALRTIFAVFGQRDDFRKHQEEVLSTPLDVARRLPDDILRKTGYYKAVGGVGYVGYVGDHQAPVEFLHHDDNAIGNFTEKVKAAAGL